jgi:hypothetical protein
MCKITDKTVLTTKNSLFLSDLMNKTVHPSIIKKYA